MIEIDALYVIPCALAEAEADTKDEPSTVVRGV
jgi:hypothetical protein